MILAGSAELFRFAADDAAGRHVAAAVLRQLEFPGKDVAAVLGLTPNYVATLHQRARREGTAALVRPAGRPPETSEAAWDQARDWRAAGVRDAEIARRLGVNQSTVLRRLGRAHVQDPLPPEPHPEPETDERPAPAAPGPAQGAEPGPGDAGRLRVPRPRFRPLRGSRRRPRWPLVSLWFWVRLRRQRVLDVRPAQPPQHRGLVHPQPWGDLRVPHPGRPPLPRPLPRRLAGSRRTAPPPGPARPSPPAAPAGAAWPRNSGSAPAPRRRPARETPAGAAPPPRRAASPRRLQRTGTAPPGPGEDRRLPAAVQAVQVTRVGHAVQDGSGGGGHAAILPRFNYVMQRNADNLPQVKRRLFRRSEAACGLHGSDGEERCGSGRLRDNHTS